MKKENVEIKEEIKEITENTKQETPETIEQTEQNDTNETNDEVIYNIEILEDEEIIQDDKLIIENTENIEIFGTDKQRSEMFTDWSLYFAEVSNPENTTANTIFGGRKYSPLNEVLNEVRPILGKYGLAVIQKPYMYNGDVAVKTIVIHKSGAIMSFPQSTTKLFRPNNAVTEIQAFGSASTYLRRFDLNGVCGVCGEVDNDGNSDEEAKKGKPNANKPNPEDKLKEDLTALCKEKIKIVGKDALMAVLTKYEEKGTVAKMTAENLELAMAEVKALKKEENK